MRAKQLCLSFDRRFGYMQQTSRTYDVSSVFMIKTVLIFVLAGGLLGGLIASLVVPPALTWYITPGGLPEGAQIQALVQIPEVIRYATGKLMRAQAIGVGIGAVGGLIAGIFFVRRNRASSVPLPTQSGAEPTVDRTKVPPVGP